MKSRTAPARFGVLIYDGVEPIDVGGTVGVVSMAARVLPNITSVTIARTAGPVRLAGGLVVEAAYSVANAPACDVVIVCGGPGWPEASRDCGLIAYLCTLQPTALASVCTGAMVLAAAGALNGRHATTRRSAVGTETQSPLALLSQFPQISTEPALLVDDAVVTGGGVSLAIDATLYLIGKQYGEEARDEVARVIEYDRAFDANRQALGIEIRPS
jgi:transcriptional regulator GlxA family with amidase domain